MSLSAWEQDALNSIKNGLADSDPALVARLAMFSRLASGEDMPVREKIQAVTRRVALRRHRMCRRLGVSRAMLLVWLVTTAALIAAALASSRAGSPGPCAASSATLCGGTSAAPRPALPVP